MKITLRLLLLFVVLTTVSCKDMFVISKNSGCGSSGSQVSPSSDCSAPPGYDLINPPVFYRFFRVISENVISFDPLLEVALVDREPRPLRGQFYLLLVPDVDPEIIYSAKVKMGVDSNNPNLSADITAWASRDGSSVSEQLGSTTVSSGKSVVFPDYSGGKKYFVKTSFRWLVFKAKYKGGVSIPTESNAQLYMGYNW